MCVYIYLYIYIYMHVYCIIVYMLKTSKAGMTGTRGINSGSWGAKTTELAKGGGGWFSKVGVGFDGFDNQKHVCCRLSL